MKAERDEGASPPDVGAIWVQGALVGPRAYDGRTVGYIALGDGLRVVDTGQDVGVSPPDVGVFYFQGALIAPRAGRLWKP